MFQEPVQSKKVRRDIVAYKYRNGTIVINGQKYLIMTMTEAIYQYRKSFPIISKHN